MTKRAELHSQVLGYLAICSMPATCGEVADFVGSTSCRTSNSLQQQAKKGLVEPVGERPRYWRLTDAGRASLSLEGERG